MLDRIVDVVAEIGERDDLFALRGDFVRRESEQRRCQLDVRESGVLRMKPRAELEQRADATVDDEGSARGLDDPANDFQQRRFSGAILADDAKRFSDGKLERDGIERAK